MTANTETLTYDHIVALALEHGFKLKPQADGRMALNDYVIDFARAVYGIGRADAVDAARAEAPMAMVQCHGSAEHPLYTADQLAAAVAAARISALCDTLLNRPARNAGLESEYAAEAAAKAETAAPVAGRWYFVTSDGAATLCDDEADARESAAEADIAFPRMAPHRAVQLVPADQLAAAVAAEREKCAGIVNELRMECARRNMPESATMLWHAENAIRARGEWGE